MHRTFIMPLAFFAALMAPSADAKSRFPGAMDAQDRYEQQRILAEEFRRAREVGGYNDPITALRNLFSGTATERDIRPGVNSIYDVPGHGGLRLKSRRDE